MIKLKKLRFLIIPFAVLGCVLLLASCKGTGTYYQKGYEDSFVQITSSEYISFYKGKESRVPITWLNDNYFYFNDDLYYCDGSILYNLDYPDNWYSSKIIHEVKK